MDTSDTTPPPKWTPQARNSDTTHTGQLGHDTSRTHIEHQTPRLFNSSHRKIRETLVASMSRLHSGHTWTLATQL